MWIQRTAVLLFLKMEIVSFPFLTMHHVCLLKICLGSMSYKNAHSSVPCSESLNELGQVELKFHDKPSAIEAEGHQDGKHN